MASVFGLDEGDIADNATQDSCATWSSLRHMLLMAGLEEQFGIEFSMDEMLTMKTLPKIVTIVRAHAATGS